ncbi:MAG: AAA family ATPase [Candidatus Jordarchaeaceae archaeon]
MPKNRRIRVDYISTPLADVPTVDALEDVVNSINSLKEELDSLKGGASGLSGEIIETVKKSISTLTDRINGLEEDKKDLSQKFDSVVGALAATILLTQKVKREKEVDFQVIMKKPEELTFTFDHLGNYEDAKAQLEDYASFLGKIPELKSRGVKLGGKLLICGRPGTGKTTLVYALAKESKVPIIDFQKSLATGPPEDIATGIHAIFKFVREDSNNKPLILFIDNFDALAQSRDLNQSSVLSALLDELDSTNLCDHSILVIAATNRPDLLDAAVWTRFDDVISVPLPDVRARAEILHLLLSRLLYEKNIDFPQVSEATENFSGADLENLVSRAVVLLEKRRKKILTTDILLEIAHSMRTEISQRIKEKQLQKRNLQREEYLHQALVQDVVTDDKKYEKLLLTLTKLKSGDSLSKDEILIAKNFDFLTSNPEKSIEVLKEKRERFQRVQETMQKMWGAKT